MEKIIDILRNNLSEEDFEKAVANIKSIRGIEGGERYLQMTIERVRESLSPESKEIDKQYNDAQTALKTGFAWLFTDEGADYWSDIFEAIGKPKTDYLNFN